MKDIFVDGLAAGVELGLLTPEGEAASCFPVVGFTLWGLSCDPPLLPPSYISSLHCCVSFIPRIYYFTILAYISIRNSSNFHCKSLFLGSNLQPKKSRLTIPIIAPSR